jgi:hypothetical protein
MKYKFAWWHLLILIVIALFLIPSDKSSRLTDSTNAPDEFIYWNNDGATEIFPESKIYDKKPMNLFSLFSLYAGSDVIESGQTQEISFLTYSDYTCWDTKAQYRIFRPDGGDDPYFSSEGLISPGNYIFINFYYSNTNTEGAYDGWSWLTCEDDYNTFMMYNPGASGYAPGFLIGGIDYDYPLFTVEEPPDPCAPDHYTEKCYAGQLWWYDACNHRNDLSSDCGTGMCPPGATACDDCQPFQDHQGCSVDGDAAWFDDCNRLNSVIDDCDPATHQCVLEGSTATCQIIDTGCTQDTECADNEYCLVSAGTCLVGCRDDNDPECGPDQMCESHVCVTGCRDASDCDANEECADDPDDQVPWKVCITTGCDSDNDCGNQQICDQGTCTDVDCVNDGDCQGLEVCEVNTCVEVECLSDGNCAAGEYCAPDNTCQVTVNCTQDSDCGDLELCVNNQCSSVECVIDTDCDDEGDECNSNVCQTPCSADSNCEALEVCTIGYCTAIDCNRDEDCEGHSNCQDVMCECEDQTCIRIGGGGGGGSSSKSQSDEEPEIDWAKVAAEKDAREKAEKQKKLFYMLLLGAGAYLLSKQSKKGKKKKKERRKKK